MVEWVTFVRDIPVTVLCLCIGVIFVKRQDERKTMKPLEKLYEMRNKWEGREDFDLNKNEFRLVGEFLDEINLVIGLLEEKKKTCCGGVR